MKADDPDLILLRQSMTDPGAMPTVTAAVSALIDASAAAENLMAQGAAFHLASLQSLLTVLRAAGIDPGKLAGATIEARCRDIIRKRGPACLAALTAQALIETRPEESRHHWLVVAKTLQVFAQVTSQLRREEP